MSCGWGAICSEYAFLLVFSGIRLLLIFSRIAKMYSGWEILASRDLVWLWFDDDIGSLSMLGPTIFGPFIVLFTCMHLHSRLLPTLVRCGPHFAFSDCLQILYTSKPVTQPVPAMLIKVCGPCTQIFSVVDFLWIAKMVFHAKVKFMFEGAAFK